MPGRTALPGAAEGTALPGPPEEGLSAEAVVTWRRARQWLTAQQSEAEFVAKLRPF